MGGKPLDGYVRVSQVAGRSGDRFQSPDTQRETIAGWAKANGVRIGKWHEDLDQSGGTMDRPGMNDALRRVEKGLSGGVVVARLDRFARTVIGGLTTIQELDKRGARVVSVAEAIDPATPMGRAMLGLLLIMAEWQRDQADEHLAAAQLRATSAGRFPGKPAFGYARTDDGLTVIDPKAAEVVHRIFEARARGDGWRLIADHLGRDGIATATGKRLWASSTVNGIVRSESYLGTFIGPRGLRIEGAWEPIVSRELWDAANSIRGTRDNSRRHHDRLLAGIARCAGCRHVLVRQVNPEGFVSYGCGSRGCPAKTSVGASILDDYVSTIVNDRLNRIRLQARIADDGEGNRLTAARDAANRELETWRDDVGLRTALGDADWREGIMARAKARDDAETALAEFRARGGILSASDLPSGQTLSLDMLPWEHRRKVVEGLLHSVWLRKSSVRGPGARRHVDQRVLVVWRDDARRPDLPPAESPVRW